MDGDWVFGWEAITALAGALAVIVAVLVGRSSNQLAAHTTKRSNQDYVASRADRVADGKSGLILYAQTVDDLLTPFWAWRSGESQQMPDWMPAQRGINEFEARCENLLLSVKGLHAATGALGSAPPVTDIQRELAASRAAHYVAYLYFTRRGGTTRDWLLQLYESELSAYPECAKESVLDSLGDVDSQTDLSETVYIVCRDSVRKWAKSIDELVLSAYKFASTDSPGSDRNGT